MLRASFLRAARSASIRPALAIATRQTPALMQMKMNFVRAYSSENGLSKSDVETRVIDVLKSFDKISDASKITPNATFSKDLDLDSLDTVEVLVAIEEEFNIEIPDDTADEIKSINQAVEYILAQSEAS